MIWKSIPSQLARENKKFIYKVVKEGARAREYEDALQWLVDARLVHKIYRSSAPGLPIAAYDDLSAFKIYLADVGLLRRLAQLAPTAFGEGNRLFTEFKGALTENFVLQTLITQFEVMPRYWSQNNPPYEVDFLIQRENDIFPVEVKSDNPPYEVDFLIQRENDIFPVEVKSEANTTSKSMKKFKELFPDKVKLRIRFSLDNLKLDDDVLNIPLFMADQADRLIGLPRIPISVTQSLSGWNVGNVVNMAGTFGKCISLEDASAINEWDIEKVIYFERMFFRILVHPEFTKISGEWYFGTFYPGGMPQPDPPPIPN